MTLPERLRGRPVLVTGASGFLGRRVVALGAAMGATVHALSRSGPVPGVERTWPADLRDAEAVRAAVGGARPAAVLHLAAAGVSGPVPALGELVAGNVTALANLLDVLRTLEPVPDVVVAGSGLEYASRASPIAEEDVVRPASAYGASKAAATEIASWFGACAPVTVLRLFAVYGPGERLPRLLPYVVDRTTRREPVDLTAGEQVRDFVYVDDVAEAFWAALACPAARGDARIANIGTGEGTTVRAFVESVGAALRARGLVPDLRFGARPYRPDEPMIYRARAERAAESLGWRARTPLVDGVERAVEACLADAR